MTLPPDAAMRLKKLGLMLSSEYDGERANAAAAIGRLLAQHGLSWHDYVQGRVTVAAPSPKPKKAEPKSEAAKANARERRQERRAREREERERWQREHQRREREREQRAQERERLVREQDEQVERARQAAMQRDGATIGADRMRKIVQSVLQHHPRLSDNARDFLTRLSRHASGGCSATLSWKQERWLRALVDDAKAAAQ